jgi:predicted metal-binding membrane protein
MNRPALAVKSRHDLALTLAVLAALVVFAWTYLLFADSSDTEMDKGAGQMMAMPAEWSLRHFVLTFAMWAIMMVAMMLPSATRAILHAAALLKHLRTLLAVRRTGEFVIGYLAVWLAFGLAATAMQWGLDGAGVLSSKIATTDRMLAGSVLLYAGVYEWMPLKQACLTHCRAPEEFLARHWHHGPFLTGLGHGLFCLGCCWLLMVLLFVGGVMNLAWITAIALVILVEKTLPRGVLASYAIAIVLIAWGAVTLTVPGPTG